MKEKITVENVIDCIKDHDEEVNKALKAGEDIVIKTSNRGVKLGFISF